MATYPNKIIDILNISPTFQILKISWNKACQIPVSKEKAVKYQGLIKEFKNVNWFLKVQATGLVWKEETGIFTLSK